MARGRRWSHPGQERCPLPPSEQSVSGSYWRTQMGRACRCISHLPIPDCLRVLGPGTSHIVLSDQDKRPAMFPASGLKPAEGPSVFQKMA